jgi:2'-5' RNA ligase
MISRRLFFAIWLTDRQRDSLRDVVRPLMSAIEGDFVDRRNWHVTLVFIGQFPETDLPVLKSAVADIRVESFRLRFDRAGFWPRPKIACLEAAIIPDQLQRLVGEIRQAVEPLGIQREEHSYRPHITIAQRAKTFTTQRLARAIELQCSDFTLVETVSVPGGVQYRPLKQ